MLEIPLRSQMVMRSSAGKNFLVEFMGEFTTPLKQERRYLRKLVNALSESTDLTMLTELYRSRGGLVLLNGDFVSIDLIDRNGVHQHC